MLARFFSSSPAFCRTVCNLLVNSVFSPVNVITENNQVISKLLQFQNFHQVFIITIYMFIVRRMDNKFNF